jgi:hypothetical protein
MWYFIEIDLLAEGVHKLGEFNCFLVVYSGIFFQEKENEQLVLKIDLF